MQTATTDAKGEVKINLPTREYSESQVLPLTVQLPEGNVNTQVNFVLAAQGFSIGVSTVRPVYVTGESLEATVNVRDAENKPLAQKLKLKVLERTLVEGRPGERLVEEHELTTAADGKARQTIKLDKGGIVFPAGRGDRSLPESDHGPGRGADQRRGRPRAAPHPGRPAHLQGRRHGRGAVALARCAGAWPW